MANLLNDNDLERIRAVRGRPMKYPWDEWLDGKARTLEVGVDFTCTISTFRVHFCNQCRKKGLSSWSVLETQQNGSKKRQVLHIQAHNVGVPPRPAKKVPIKRTPIKRRVKN